MSVKQVEAMKEEFTKKIKKWRRQILGEYHVKRFLPMAIVSNASIYYLRHRGTIRLDRPYVAYGAATFGTFMFSTYLGARAVKRELQNLKKEIDRRAELQRIKNAVKKRKQ